MWERCVCTVVGLYEMCRSVVELQQEAEGELISTGVSARKKLSIKKGTQCFPLQRWQTRGQFAAFSRLFSLNARCVFWFVLFFTVQALTCV